MDTISLQVDIMSNSLPDKVGLLFLERNNGSFKYTQTCTKGFKMATQKQEIKIGHKLKENKSKTPGSLMCSSSIFKSTGGMNSILPKDIPFLVFC